MNFKWWFAHFGSFFVIRDFFFFSSQSTRVGCFIRHPMGVSSSDNGTWWRTQLSPSSFARFYQEKKKSRDSTKTHFVAPNEEPSLSPAVTVIGYSRTWVVNCVFSTSMVRVSDGHHGKRQIRSDRVGPRRLFRHKWHREKGTDGCTGRKPEAKGNQRRGCPLDLWQMSGSPAARLPGRLLPSQHQSAGVRHDGLHRLETRPRSQGGSSEVCHRVSGRRGWVHVQANVPNQARAASLGEKWSPQLWKSCRFTFLHRPDQRDRNSE